MDLRGYPKCIDGDTLIVLSPKKSYQLHAHILKRHSVFFRTAMQDAGATLSSKAKRDGEIIRYRFDMVERPGYDEEGSGVLQRTELNSSGRPVANARLVYNDLTHHHPGEPPLFAFYDKVLGSIYNIPIQLDKDNTTMQDILVHVVGIMDVAQYLNCMDVVAKEISAALLNQGQTLWRSVQSDPFAWADLAKRVRLQSVYKESIIHLVGRWNSVTDTEKASLDRDVQDFCRKKHDELQTRLMQVESRIVKFYPPNLERSQSAPAKEMQRMSYANDIYGWQALCLYRHWFAAVLIAGQNRVAPDGGYQLYVALAAGGTAYLDKDEVNKFHNKFPMSTRGQHVLDSTVNGLKDMIRPLVADLMRTELNLDHERFPSQYLTCTVITQDELSTFLPKMDGTFSAEAGYGQVHKNPAQKRKEREERLRTQPVGQHSSDVDSEPEMPEMIVSTKKQKTGTNTDDKAKEAAEGQGSSNARQSASPVPSMVPDDEDDADDGEENDENGEKEVDGANS